MTTRLLAIALAAAASFACAAGAREPAVSTSASNLIVRSELERLGPVSAYDAIRRLRPAFLRGRGAVSVVNQTASELPTVFVGDALYGTIESLKQIDIGRVAQIRFYTGPESATKFGSGYSAGVISVSMRAQ